jgi:mannose-6-phosphate isomerase
MANFYPLVFQPILKERIWGGRKLETLYHKALPPGVPIGESWEISDRPGDTSVITNGPMAGKDLRWLLENHAKEVMGTTKLLNGKFPLLVKILDAQESLSLQVHPPAAKAAKLGGEPKTEMWYFTQCTPEAVIYAGLQHGTTRAEFEKRTRDGTVADCFYKLPVKADDAMFLPSGRVHALGAGSVLFEIQQNSDTTYRVFDWNRVDASGKGRELHLAQAMDSIDFNDFGPSLIRSNYSRNAAIAVRYVVDDPLFMVNGCKVRRNQRFYMSIQTPQIIGLMKGRLRLEREGEGVTLMPGQFCLVPAAVERLTVIAEMHCEYLQAEPR